MGEVMANYKMSLADDDSATQEQIDYSLRNLHTSIPCRVIKFNSSEQTVSLEILIKKKMNDGSSESYPPLLNVPISYPRGGGFAVTFPLNPGDEGQAIFSERCIDKWWHTSEPSEPIDFRLHDLSDAIFYPGLCSRPKAIKNFFNDGLSMQTLDGNTFIRITNGTIFIQGNIEHTGDTNQQGLSTVSDDVIGGGISLKNHTHGGVKSGDSSTGVPQ